MHPIPLSPADLRRIAHRLATRHPGHTYAALLRDAAERRTDPALAAWLGVTQPTLDRLAIHPLPRASEGEDGVREAAALHGADGDRLVGLWRRAGEPRELRAGR